MPSFFFTKKKFAALGLHDSHMMPLFRCSSINFVYFHNFFLRKGEESSWQGFRDIGEQFDCIIPYSVLGKPLGFLFIVYLLVSFIFIRQSFLQVVYLFWMDSGTSYEVSVLPYWPRYILCSWGEYSLFCIISTKDDQELSMVDPPLFPILLWLVCCKPRIS